MSKRQLFEISRSLSTIPSRSLKHKIPIDSAKITAKEILEEFHAHEANHHPLFGYLESISKERGLTPAQYLAYRDIFFYRTANTIISVARHLEKAARAHDYETLATNVKNLSDEGGSGASEGVHLKLLEDSHNNHGQTVFGVPKITIPEADYSQFLIEEARNFRKMQQVIFRSSYQTMTGCVLAHEDAADQMLINFRNTVFEPYRGYYAKTDFKKLMGYYDAHRDDSKQDGNVEEQHKELALEIASNIISKDSRAASLVRRGGLKFLEAQKNLWTGMMNEIEQRKNHGQPVMPKSDFLPEKEVRHTDCSAVVNTKTTGKSGGRSSAI